MKTGRFNVLLDAMWGSSGKGKVSTWLTDHFGISNVSSSNFPNAGHSAVFRGDKFVAKAIPTAASLRKFKELDVKCWLSPASGFRWDRLVQEWNECDRPHITIHDRASVVGDSHAARERDGSQSTKHIASTMQGSGAALSDKIMRIPNCELAGSRTLSEVVRDDERVRRLLATDTDVEEFLLKVQIFQGMEFRNATHRMINSGMTWLHEGSQGYALSIDHGSHYPFCTSRNCSTQKAMDDMAIPPRLMGDVYLNLRANPIRVGNVHEEGKKVGYSGDFYPDCKEMSWEDVARDADMPPEEVESLKGREFTTVTGRLRRVSSFSWIGLEDAVRVNGATKLILNFAQYVNWEDRGVRGGREAFQRLSKKTREFIDRIEDTAQAPVVLIGTGAEHEDMISRM